MRLKKRPNTFNNIKILGCDTRYVIRIFKKQHVRLVSVIFKNYIYYLILRMRFNKSREMPRHKTDVAVHVPIKCR